jgi:hypothetical protein
MNRRRITRVVIRSIGVLNLLAGGASLLGWGVMTEPYGRQPVFSAPSLELLSAGLFMLFFGWLLSFHPRWIIKAVRLDDQAEFDHN